jgi:hypothetical protein
MNQNEIFLKLIPEKDFGMVEFFVDLANHRRVDLNKCQVFQIQFQDIASYYREEFIKDIIENGWTSFLCRRPLLERVVSPGQDSNYVVSIIVDFLGKINVENELVIVDPYFFARNKDTDYPILIQSILSPFATQLQVIRIITLPEPDYVDPLVKQNIEIEIKKLNNKIQLYHSTSREYHDRFWISSNRSKGVLSGTSLNGLGKRYAIIDYLSATDVKDIVESLVNSKLI